MKKRIKRLWVDALRSGKFQQGVGSMKQSVNDEWLYCCLGVLEEIHASDTKKPFSTARGVEYLSVSCRNWAGLEERDPVVLKRHLSELNDESKSFKWIADRIEKYL